MLYYHVLRRNEITFALSAETQSVQPHFMFTSPGVDVSPVRVNFNKTKCVCLSYSYFCYTKHSYFPTLKI